MSKSAKKKDEDLTLWDTTTLSSFTPLLTKDLFERSYGDITVAVSRFLDINREALSFLDITASVDGGGDRRLHLATARYGGVVPLRAVGPKPKQILLSVHGRFGEEVTDLLPLLREDFEPEFDSSMLLPCQSPLQPPIYLECLKLIDRYLEAERLAWHKFDTTVRVDPYVAGLTDWPAYALQSAINPARGLRFPNKRNVLSRNHSEQNRINYALSVALDHLSKAPLSPTLRAANEASVARAASLLRERHREPCQSIPFHSADNAVIRDLKLRANNVLSHSTAQRVAWRIDQAQFFERYVQYICRQAALQCGMQIHANRHIAIHGFHSPWTLSYLEPDVIMEGSGHKVIVDAKYKGNMIYGSDISNIQLADEFRHDLHQILAYTAVTGADYAMLVYPSKTCRSHRQTIENKTITLVGIPISRAAIPETLLFVSTHCVE